MNDPFRALVEKAVEVLQRHAPPDGLSDHDALTELYGIFDGPEYRSACEARSAIEPPQSPEWLEAWRTFVKDYNRYVEGDLKMPFSLLRHSIAEFMWQMDLALASCEPPSHVETSEKAWPWVCECGADSPAGCIHGTWNKSYCVGGRQRPEAPPANVAPLESADLDIDVLSDAYPDGVEDSELHPAKTGGCL
jgi:hypothetical protein